MNLNQTQPPKAEDPFADLPLCSPSQQSTSELWMNSMSNYPIATDDPPANVKILKRDTTSTNRSTQSSHRTPAATSHELESRAKVKEEQYQRARERILGSDEEFPTDTQHPQWKPTTSYPLPAPPENDADEFRRYPVTYRSATPSAFMYPQWLPTSPILGWNPALCPPIGYINIPGIPPLPIPPPPAHQELVGLHLPTPSTPPPFPIYPPAPYLPPPFVLFPHPTSAAGNGSFPPPQESVDPLNRLATGFHTGPSSVPFSSDSNSAHMPLCFVNGCDSLKSKSMINDPAHDTTPTNDSILIRPSHKNKFKPVLAQSIIKQVLAQHLSGKAYDAEQVSAWTRSIADTIRTKLQDLNLDRYKYVVNVVIGERAGEGVRYNCRCIWDLDTDNHAQEVFTNDSIFCVAVAFGIFYY